MRVTRVLKRTGSVLLKNFLAILLVTLAINIINKLLSFSNISMGSFALRIILSLFIGLLNTYLAIEIYMAEKEGRKVKILGIFNQMKAGGSRVLHYYFIMQIKTFLWFLLFIIPGIIKGLEYQRGVYAIAENKNMEVADAFEVANQEMTGYKGTLFLNYLFVAIPIFILAFVIVLFIPDIFVINEDLTIAFTRQGAIIISIFNMIISLFINTIAPVFNIELNKQFNYLQ